MTLSRGATLAVLLLCGCGIPRDIHGTLDRARGGTLRVGASDELHDLVVTLVPSLDSDSGS